MTDSQLQKGNELQKKLAELKDQIIKWEESRGVWSIGLSKSIGGGTDDFRNIATSPIDFHVLKTLVLKKLTDDYAQLENEYNNL